MKRLIDEQPTALERSLLDVGRDVGGSDQGKAKLLATVAVGGLVSIGATQMATASKAWGAWFGTGAAKVGVVAALTVGAGTGGWLVQRSMQPRAPGPSAAEQAGQPHAVNPTPIPRGGAAAPDTLQAAQESNPGTPSASAAPPDVQGHPVLGPASESSFTTTTPSVPRRSSARALNAGAAQRSLLEETELLERLRRAVEQRDHNLAEALSRSYWQRFSAGQLAPEARRLDERWRALSPTSPRMDQNVSPR
jgi:hypothetical protein